MRDDGWKHVVIPPDEWDEIVLPEQRRIYEATGKLVTYGLIVRQLMARGYAANISDCNCQVLSK